MKVLLVLLAILLSGCVSIEYTDSIGRRLKYEAPAFGVKAVRSLTMADGTKLEGYSSEQSSMVDFIRSIYEAGVTAGAKLK